MSLDNPVFREKAPDIAVSREKVQEKARRARETNERGEEVVYTYDNHALGKWELSDAEKAKVSVENKDFEMRAIGGVDATPFDPDKIDQNLLLKMSDWAEKFAELFVDGKIVTNFKTLEGDQQMQLLSVVDEIARVKYDVKSGKFDLVKFKEKLASNYPADFTYGGQGAFNVLLAVHRADEAVRGKGFSRVLYDLRAGNKKLSQAQRFSEVCQRRPEAGPGEFAIIEAKNEKAKKVGELMDSMDGLKSEMETNYGAKVNVQLGKGVDEDDLVSVRVESGNGVVKNFYARVMRRGTKVSISLSKVSVRGEEIYDDVGAAVKNFKAQVVGFLDKGEKRKVKDAERNEDLGRVEFAKNVKNFFEGPYLKDLYKDSYVSTNPDGKYAGEVEVKGAQYALHVNKDSYFVFPHEATKSVEFKFVAEVGENKFALVTKGELDAGNLKTDADKKSFAVKIAKMLEAK